MIRESPQPRQPVTAAAPATAGGAAEVIPLAAYRAGGRGSETRLVIDRPASRLAWQVARARMEADGRRFTRTGPTRLAMVPKFLGVILEPSLAAVGLKRRGLANALAVATTEVAIEFPELPRAFDGYTILQLSDLHVGQLPGLAERTAALLAGLAVDLVAITGDIQSWGLPAAERAADEVATIVAAVAARDGVLGVLGNHDSHELVEPLERRGVRMLVNERARLARGADRLDIVGLDDVHRFYSDAAGRLLRARDPQAFSIALVHTPEMADVAAEAGHRLYLAGHSHGGQICLPGGRPLLTALDRHHRAYASGLWRYGEMTGFTSRGVGVARPARFNCPPEIVVVRLRRGPAAAR